MQVVGHLSIEIMAGIARLQSDMDKAKRIASNAADAMQKVLGSIGIGISVAGFANLIKSTADAADKMRDLKIISGLAIEQLGGLGKAAAMNGSNIDQVARAVGVMSKNMYAGSEAFNVLGVQTNAADGSLRDAGQVLLDVADKFSMMQDGATKSALANQIFGKSGRDLIPTLNQGRGELEQLISTYAQHSGMTIKLADDSDRFNDILFLLGERVTGVKNTFVGELLPTLNQIGTAMLSAGQSTNQFSFSAQVVVPVLKGLAIASFTVVDTFRGMGREIGARAAQLAALANMDFKGAKFIGTALAEDNKKSRIEFDKFIDTVMNGDKSIKQLTETQKEYLKIEQQLPGAVEETTRALKKKKVLTDAEQLSALRQQESTKRTIDLYQDAKRLTDSVATSQDKYNSELTELNRLRPYVSVGTYDRALAKLNETTVKTATVTKTATDEVSQLWMQAGRNIQSTLANSIFNFFDDGLKGMVKNVGIAVGRILSEFAALRLAQSISLAGMFTAGGASASGGATSGANLLNIASLGTNAASLFKGGLGSMGLMSSIGGMLPGQAGAFFGGMGGGTVAGVSSTASLMGSSFAAVAGPAVALFAVDAIGRMLAGDKKLGGAEHIPVIGGFLAAMFGRGPMKFRQQVAIGEATSEGFDGRVTDVFRAKGGLFVGNKHREQAAENEAALLDLFDTTIKGYAAASRGFATNLGLDVEIINGYHKTIRLESEKKKTLTEEAIRDMLTGIGNEMADSLVPAISTLKKTGEDSFGTLSRLNSEFVTLSGAARVLGLSLEDSKTAIRSAGFELRTSFVDAAGGAESFSNKIGFVADNFLTAEQKLAMGTEDLNAALTKLDVPLGTTKDQFYALLQSAAQAGDAIKFGGLLDVAQIYLNVSSAAEQVMLAEQAHAQSITAAADKFLTAEQLYTRSSRDLNAELKSLGVSTDITKEGYLKLIQAGGDLGESLALLADHFLSVRNSSQYMTESLANSPRAGRVVELNAQRRKEQNDPYKWYAGFQENIVADMRASESLRTTTLLNRDPAEFLRQFNAAPSDAPRILDQATTDKIDALAAAIKNLGIAANDANFNLLAPAYNLNLVMDQTGINFETLTGRLDYFANNFLDGSEKTKLASDAISQSLKSVGIASIENADKLKTLIMSFGSAGGVSAEQFSTLLEIAPLLKEQFDAQKNVNAALDDNIAALRSATEIASEHYGLETQLLQIQGSTTELRKRELDALDPSNRALQERIWALGDEKTAIDKLTAGVDTAFSALQRSVDGERATLTTAFNSALAESEKRISSVSESVSKLTSLSELLKSTTASITTPSQNEAQGRVRLSIDSGDLNNGELRGAIETLGKQQLESDFSNRVDFMRGQAKNVGLLDELNSVTKAELTLEERTLSALEAAKRRIEDGFRADIERLDQIVTSAQAQIDVLRGIDISILTIPAAIAGLGASIQSANTAMAAAASASAAAASASAAALQQVAAKPFGLDDQPAAGMFRLVSGNEIPKFASGTSFVPRTGPAIVHQGERIINPEQNQDLIRLLGQLVQKIADGNADTAELLRVLKSMRVETDDGIAIRNQVAA